MKKRFHPFLYILCLFVLVPVAGVFAQVNRDELQNLGPVEFINYEGPYSRIETRAQIRAIGYSLGVMVRNGQTRAGGSGRYFVIHSVSEADGFKIDADIFGLGVDVGVDHIRNLRLIIQGYLEAAYDYTERDAALLAEYVTIYNAIYRGDMDYINSRYKKDVLDNITQEKAGLSIRYDEWPGRTLMLIPLGMGSAGPLSSIDTTPLTDSRVTEQLRQEPDASIDTRKDMVDLKERQSDEAAQQAEVQREAIRQEEERLARERQAAQQRQEEARRQQEETRQRQEEAQREQQRIAEERQRADADQAALDEQQRAAEEQRQQAAADEQAAAGEQAAAEQQQEELDQQEEQLDEQREQAEETQQYADEKAEEAQQDRQGIAEDQQAIINQEDAQRPPPAAGVIGTSIITRDASLGRIVKIDPSTGRETMRSGLNTVNARSLVQADGKILSIAGENRGNGAIRLIEINKDTLEMVKQGDDDIAPTSLLWVSGSDLYAISSSGGNFYIARFNTNLEIQARSSVTVHPFAAVSISEGNLMTQRADGTALLLNPSDLTERR